MPRFLFLSFLWCTFSLAGFSVYAQTGFYQVVKGSIAFTSDAPLELIQARSTQLRGLIDPTKNTYAFTVQMNTFDGFNSPLQREHFNENYLETQEIPTATFSGKIIESIDFNQEGEYTIRAKGKLRIHGVEQERIIKSTLVVKGGQWKVRSEFSVLLADHDISIPKIVYQKIAEEIQVVVEADLQKQAP